MIADITIKTWKQATNHSPSGDFNVTYLTAEDGKQYTVYDNTPGTGLIAQDAKVTLHYKENVKDGKTFCNCYNITAQNTKTTGEQILATLQNILETLHNMLSATTSKHTTLENNASATRQDSQDLPF